LNTNYDLYDALRMSRTLEGDRLDEIDKRTIDLFLADFEQSGVHLPAEQVDLCPPFR
jgi:Zn-dependent oligopeptidase